MAHDHIEVTIPIGGGTITQFTIKHFVSFVRRVFGLLPEAHPIARFICSGGFIVPYDYTLIG